MISRVWARSFLALMLSAVFGCVLAYGQTPDLTDRVRDKIQVNQFRFSTLAIPEDLPEFFTTTVEHEGEVRVLNLYKHSIRGPNYQLLVQQAGGKLVAIKPGPVRTYRGYVAGETTTVVAATLGPAGLRATVHSDYEPSWSIRPLRRIEPSAPRESHVIYWENDVESPDLSNDLVSLEIPPTKNQLSWSANNEARTSPAVTDLTAGGAGEFRSLAPYGCAVKQAELSIDLEYKYYVWQDSDIPTIENNIDVSVSYINAIYVRDCLIEHVLGRVIIRTDQTTCPYYDLTTLLECYYATATEWSTNQSDVSPNMIGMVASPRFGGGWGSGPGYCSFSAISANGVNYTTTTDGEFYYVLRHELGHNWGCGDFHQGCPEGLTIMCGNALPGRFSGLEVASIIAVRDASSCLTDIGGWPSSMAPYTALDRVYTAVGEAPVTIDVLGNDHDANCDTITIDSFESTSSEGGTVTRSVGSGPGGRDELIYTLPAGVHGIDSFTYTADDGTGQQATGNVHINIRAGRLTSYWQLDETSGATASDSSGSGPVGILKGGQTFDSDSIAGQYDGALDFDGTNDYVELSGLNLNTNTLTITAWIKRNGNFTSPPNYWPGIVFCYYGFTDAGFIVSSGHDLRYMWEGTNWSWSSGLYVPNNVWTFAALVIEPDRVTVYQDSGSGLTSATRSATHGVQSFSGITCIGQDARGDRFFKGGIDDVRIYDYALSGADITEVRDGGKKACNPFPYDGATEAPTITPLTWVPAIDAAEHDVYFGTNEFAVTNADTSSAEYRGRQTETVYFPPASASTQYFWRLDEVTAGMVVTTGAVWSFTTSSTPIETELKVHYTFDSADISGSTAYDVSGAPVLNGLISGSTGAAGQIAEALNFDGLNDTVRIPAMSLNSNTVTMTAWINREAVQVYWAGLLNCTTGGTYAGMNIADDTGPWNLRYSWNDGSGATWGWNSGLSVPANEWVFTGLVIEPEKATMYLNGASATNVLSHTIEQFTAYSYIGKENFARPFAGKIDDVAIWKRSLSETEMQALYYRGLSGKSFDNTPPSFVADPLSEPNAREGAIYNESIADQVADPDPSDALSFSVTAGASWLDVDTEGNLSGVPRQGDIGLNQFTVRVEDGQGGSDEAQLNITVIDTYSGELGMVDYALFASFWLENDCPGTPNCDGADINGDGWVNTLDLERLVNNWCK